MPFRQISYCTNETLEFVGGDFECWIQFSLKGQVNYCGRFPTRKVPEISIESLDESYISRWSLEVFTTIKICFRSKSRPWNLKYADLKYEHGEVSNRVPPTSQFMNAQTYRYALRTGFLEPITRVYVLLN